MQTAGRPVTALLALVAALALFGCTPTGGPLGTPSSPAPTGDASVVPPSGDATPGPTDAPSASPTIVPSAPTPSSSAASPTPAAPTPTATPAPSGTAIVRAYFVLGSFTGNAGLVPVLRDISATTGVAAAAMRQLIAGPSADELGARPAMYTSVPAATKLLGLTIKGGVATVNLSKEFDTGLNAAGLDARFGQVVYTLTQFSTVDTVALQIDGSPVSVPAVRTGYQDKLLPAIFVDRPAWGAAAGNPAKVSGVANVFEAAFRIQIKDGKGKVIADQQVMASCGTGCWGTFSTTIAYTVSKAQWGTLRVFDLSARDGTPVDVTEYPVWLTPAG
jgi:germination protein M